MSIKGNILEEVSVVSFLKYAATYCALVEEESTPVWDMGVLLKCKEALAGVYLSACGLPQLDWDPIMSLERLVQESDYDRVRHRMERLFGEHDYFLDVQVEDMKYSDVPVGVSTSELLADLYQILADTVWVFRSQLDKSMYQAIAELKYSFDHEWGSLLLALLRQLHHLAVDPYFSLLADGATPELDEAF